MTVAQAFVALIESGNWMAVSHHTTCKVVRDKKANDCDCGKEDWEQAMDDIRQAIEDRDAATTSVTTVKV